MTHYLSFLKLWLSSKFDNDEGATMVEYGLMIALVALVVGVAAYALGGGVSGLFVKASSSVSSAP